jgi:P-type Cu+ transporter
MSEPVILRVDGMMCQNNCGTTVQNALMSVLGVKKATVNFTTRSAIVEGTAHTKDLITAIDEVGFDACLIEDSPPSQVLTVIGMMCQKNCGTTVANALKSVPGVLWAKADFLGKSATIWGDNIDAQILIDAVEDVGFEAMVQRQVSKSPASTDGEESELPDGVYWLSKSINPMIDIPRIRNLLLDLAGVMSVEVDHDSRFVKVWGFADVASVQGALHSGGFPSTHFHTIEEAAAAQKHQKTVSSSFEDSKAHPGGALSPPVSALVDSGKLYVLTLVVGGMSCANCSKAVETNLLKIDGVAAVRVALLSGRVEITYDVSKISGSSGGPPPSSAESLFSAKIIKLGYSAALDEAPRRLGTTSASKRTRIFNLQVTGMSGPSSAREIEKVLKAMTGVSIAVVDCQTDTAKVTLDNSVADCVGPRAVMAAIEGLGYWCKYVPHASGDVNASGVSGESANIIEWGRLLIIALIFGLPVMVLHISMLCFDSVMMFLDVPQVCNGGITRGQMVMVCLNLPMQVLVGYRFYRGAFLGAMHGSFGMDCLVVTGTTITFVYSFIQLCLSCQSGEPSMHIFFETSGMLLMFVTLGKYLEAYAKGSTASAMTSLLKLQPQKVLIPVYYLYMGIAHMDLYMIILLLFLLYDDIIYQCDDDFMDRRFL